MKPQMNTNIRKLHDLGQRIWLGSITREMPNNGTLARCIAPQRAPVIDKQVASPRCPSGAASPTRPV